MRVKYKSQIQSVRSKYLKGKKLSPDEQALIDKELAKKDYQYFNEAKTEKFIIPEKYSADNTFAHTIERIEKCSRSQKRRRIIYLSQTVAAAAVLLLVYNLLFQSYTAKAIVPEILTVSTGYGEHKKVELPDGSKVVLNNLTSLAYPSQFNQKDRKVDLSGEAYFDVQTDENKPFVVSTDRMDVQVHGTLFNLKAYPDEGRTTTSLLKGSVSIKQAGKEPMRVKPDERAIYDLITNTHNIHFDRNLIADTAWMSGILVFDDEPFGYVVNTLKREKNVYFSVINTNLLTLRLTARFMHDESIDDIIGVLSKSLNFSYSYSEKEKLYIIK